MPRALALALLASLAVLTISAPLAAADQPPPPSPLCTLSIDPQEVDEVRAAACELHECMRYTYQKIALIRRCLGV